MRRKLIIDGNAVYEIDDECMRRKEGREGRQSMTRGQENSQKEPQRTQQTLRRNGR